MLHAAVCGRLCTLPPLISRPANLAHNTHSNTHTRSAHFEQHSYFGLLPSQVVFFQQGFLPCLTEAGAVIMEAPGRVRRCVWG